jgi:UDP-N-acetylmuramoyl-L-alanyl-D-glutamate--2,6-diaminopimelate ligase
MHLQQLLSKIPTKKVHGGETTSDNPVIASLEYDSRKVRERSLFFAIKGLTSDGHFFIDQTLRQGAAGIVSEEPPPADFPALWIQVASIRRAMAVMADEFFGRPSASLDLIGITGTNGKTTTAFLVHSIQKQSGPSVLMGTIKTVVADEEVESIRTTPEAIDIQRTLAQAVERACSTGVMEVSSHALALDRVLGCRFPVAVFTNLTQDHLDFHGSLEVYFEAKRLLFLKEYNPALRYAVVNGDDAYSRRLTTPVVPFLTYGFSRDNSVHPKSLQTSVEGTTMDLQLPGRSLRITSPTVGEHNVYNIMAAVLACSLLGLDDQPIQEGIAALRSVPGRFEKVDVPAPFAVIVDYAHTPDALANVLRLCRKLTRNRVVCLFGCGGDRDRAKRPLMGAIAAGEADRVWITSDNPRSEEPEGIINDILTGVPEGSNNCEVVTDRREAIWRAIQSGQEGDVILLAGKGHETYQEAKGVKIHFDDREIAAEALKSRFHS